MNSMNNKINGDGEYNLSQLMIAAAGREIADKEVVFVGMRLPLLGFLLAKSTHAPEAIGVYELGIVRDTVAPEPILTMGDLPNLHRAQWLADTADAMALLQQGAVDVSYIGGIEKIETRLPGSGGACDLACLGKRHIIVMNHEKRRFVPAVDYITSPGFGNGSDWRARMGLPRGGPAAVITTLGVLRFDPDTCEMVLSATHPGVTVEQVCHNTGWPLKVAEDVAVTPEPTRLELDMIRRFDPKAYWSGG